MKNCLFNIVPCFFPNEEYGCDIFKFFSLLSCGKKKDEVINALLEGCRSLRVFDKYKNLPVGSIETIFNSPPITHLSLMSGY